MKYPILRLIDGDSSEMAEKDSNEVLRGAFMQFDQDKSGLISRDELQLALTKMGDKMTTVEVDDLMKIGDQDRDGFLNYEEFVTMTSERLIF